MMIPSLSFEHHRSVCRTAARGPVAGIVIMKISARNQIKGTIVDVSKGATTSHVRIEVAAGLVLTASITNEAVEELGLKKGMTATAIIKASDMMIGIA